MFLKQTSRRVKKKMLSGGKPTVHSFKLHENEISAVIGIAERCRYLTRQGVVYRYKELRGNNDIKFQPQQHYITLEWPPLPRPDTS